VQHFSRFGDPDDTAFGDDVETQHRIQAVYDTAPAMKKQESIPVAE
jgi:hypothetical protein